LLSRWSICRKLLVGLGLLLAIVVTLSWSGFDGLYAYRALLKNLRRLNELPLATELGYRVSDLRVAALDHWRDLDAFAARDDADSPDALFARETFRHRLSAVQETLDQYAEQLRQAGLEDAPLGDYQRERQTVERVRALLAELQSLTADELPQFGDQAAALEDRLRKLQGLVAELPEYLQESIYSFPHEVRSEYRRRIALAWLTSVGTLALLGLSAWLTYKWIFRPLRLLIKGSRKVAADRFDYRIQLDSRDEMGDLAAAMNQMTQRFQAIHDDLDRQVQERTRQVVRSEQLASVALLAAGVAHEINAPLSRIAACAKAVQQRMEMRSRDTEPQRRATQAQLRQIQDEAFRCKEITQSLLEFSRMGSAERQIADLAELVQGVIDMLRHVGRYKDKRIEFASTGPVMASINVQQIRVVLLNLLCQGLEAIEPSGRVTVELRGAKGHARGSARGRPDGAEHGAPEDNVELIVSDNGRGMTKLELAEVFQPCGLRHGRLGTGLGLAISARIVKDHGGCVTAASPGPGQGAQFRVSLPSVEHAARVLATQLTHAHLRATESSLT
jgi:signal transduction histidine kinase